ncbi:MAG: hypothetical protein AAF850_01675 [Pseudomonadota bacterium]
MSRHILILFMSFIAVACSRGDAQTQAAASHAKPMEVMVPTENARVAAVYIRADWCSSCKILEPKLKAAKKMNAVSGLEHITLDYTDRNKSAFFAKAEKAGVAQPIKMHLDGGVTTGIVLLVDLKDKTILADLRKTLETEEIYDALVHAAAL